MTPLAPVRMLLLGLITWAILGTSLYWAYDAYKSLTRPPIAASHPIQNYPVEERTIEDHSVEERKVPAENRPFTAQQERRWWLYAQLGLALLGVALSMGGRLPVRLLFSQSADGQSATEPNDPQPTSTLVVDGPAGSRLHCAVYGQPGRPTLILTHGWSLSSVSWRDVLPDLVAHYRVVTWDLPGLGQSHGPDDQDYSLERMSNDLRSILDATCKSEPVILVGHSIGGMIEQTFCRTNAATLGTRVKAIVLLHTTFTNPLTTNMFAGIARPMQPLLVLLNNLMIPLSPLMRLSNWQSYWNGSLHINARLESFTGKQTWEQLDRSARLGAAASPSVLARGNLGMIEFDEQPTLPEIMVPVLVVGGSHDRLTVLSASKRIEDLLTNDRSYVNPGGHLGYWEYHKPVAQAILEFARSVMPTKSIEATS